MQSKPMTDDNETKLLSSLCCPPSSYDKLTKF
jgi:hypothetical protein